MLRMLLPLLALSAAAQAVLSYPNATIRSLPAIRLGRRSEPGPATVGPCQDDTEYYCVGEEDFCCPLDLDCDVDDSVHSYNCVAPSTDPDPGTDCLDDSFLCTSDSGEASTCCPVGSECQADGSCRTPCADDTYVACGVSCCATKDGYKCHSQSETCVRDDGSTDVGGTTTRTKTTGTSTKQTTGSSTASASSISESTTSSNTGSRLSPICLWFILFAGIAAI